MILDNTAQSNVKAVDICQPMYLSTIYLILKMMVELGLELGEVLLSTNF